MRFYYTIKKQISVFVFTVITVLFTHSINAQNLGNSPYSRFGLGDLVLQGFSNANGMGGVGISYNYLGHINNLNPALIARQSPRRYTKFDAGVLGQFKSLKSKNNSQQDFAGSLHYLAFAFPVSKKWSSAIGLTPYSSTNFENSFRQKINNADFYAEYTLKGRGNISNLYLTNAINLVKLKKIDPEDKKSKIVNTELYAGLKLNYLFGAVINEQKTRINDGLGSSYTPVNYTRTKISHLTFEPGILFRQGITYQKTISIDSVTKKKTKVPAKLYLAIGFVSKLGGKINAKRFNYLERRGDNDVLIDSDTLSQDIKGSINIPTQYSIGVSLENEGKWALALDFSTQNWSNYKNFDNTDNILKESMSLGLGGEWIPGKKGFWGGLIYRTGLSYKQTPITIEGKQVEDISASLGISIPIFRRDRQGFSLFNLSLIGGQRGNLSNNPVRDRYVKVNLGITINDKWFNKQKID